MNWTLLSTHLSILALCKHVCSEPIRGQDDRTQIGCQQKSTSGRDYLGEANITVDGIPCQKWSDTEPHDHSFTHVGDHNFCRNPVGDPDGVWCYTTDPGFRQQYCPVPFCPPFKALDFSLDNDSKPDKNNSYTHASLQKENLPPSFTICTAFIVEAWAEYTNAHLFVLRDDKGRFWHTVKIYAATTYTQFSIRFENLPRISFQSKNLFYALQWTRVCLSKDSNTSLSRLVVDGELLIEQEVKVKNQPDNLELILGWDGNTYEFPGQTTDLNIFSSALTVEQMKSQTSPGEKECGLEGDFLSWEKSLEEEQWTLHSKARWVDLDGGLEGPCRAKAQINVFLMNEWHYQSDCMKHCEKLGGRCPSVKTEMEWENLLKEVKLVSPDPSKLPEAIWLSATEGDIGFQLGIESKLGKLDHWPKGVEAKEGVWRDYYTGEQLENYTKPWYMSSGDKDVGDTHNCIFVFLTKQDTRTWVEWECYAVSPRGCPCTYDSPPLIHLRGFWPDTNLEHKRYTVTQTAANPSNIVLVGYNSARIQYDSSLRQWVYSDPRLNITAYSTASPNSFVLGKHNWTVSGDEYLSSKNKDYEIELKLTGCKADEFTCNDGQCVKIAERCDQLPQCEDESDEQNCKVLVLQHGYNKRVPPLVANGEKNIERKILPMKVSLTLQKVVAIEEDDHSISFKFTIDLMWRENRVTYENLKNDSKNNMLTQEEINMLWLPLVTYWNTDQGETTRLGVEWEWKTGISVQRQGMPKRNLDEQIDEAEIFKGSENSLKMEQTYTHAFQCVFKLAKYPFDTQVNLYFMHSRCSRSHNSPLHTLTHSDFLLRCALSSSNSILTFPYTMLIVQLFKAVSIVFIHAYMLICLCAMLISSVNSVRVGKYSLFFFAPYVLIL